MMRLSIPVLFAALLFSGCGGGTEEAKNPPVQTPPTNNAGANNGATDNGATGNGTVQPPPPPPATTGDAGGQATELAAPAAALAPYARALSIVRPDDFAVVKVDLASARKAKVVQSVQEDTLKDLAAGARLGPGADKMTDSIEKVDMVWAAVGPPMANAPPDVPVSFTIYVRAVDAAAIDEFMKENPPPEGKNIDYNGQTYTMVEEGPVPAYYWRSGAEVFFSMDEAAIKQAIDAGGKIVQSPILEKLANSKLSADVVIAGSLGPFKQQAAAALSAMLKQLPIPLDQTAGKLPAQIEWATIGIDLEDPLLVDIDADMDSPEAAKNFQETLKGLVSLGNIMLQQQAGQLPDDPAAKEIVATIQKVLAAVKVEATDKHVDASLAHVPELDKLPELAASAGSAAPKLDAMNNLRFLAIAALNHQSATSKFPANIKGAEGNELLSWRVVLLPYLEEKLLYDQIDTSAAWDSPANEKQLDKELLIYTAGEDDPRLTVYKLLPDAPGGMMIIATGEGTGVHWAKPDNFSIDRNNPQAALGPEPEGGFVVAFRDGHVERLTTGQIVEKLPAPTDVETPDKPAPDPDPETPDPEPEPDKPAPVARTWTDASGKFSVDAVFVSYANGKVTLKRTDTGKMITLPVDQLSDADKQYLKSLRR